MGALPILPTRRGAAAPRVPRKVGILARRLARTDGAAAGAFARALLEKAPHAFVETTSEASLERVARRAFRLFARKPADRPAVSAATAEGSGWLMVSVRDRPFLLQTTREVLRRSGRIPLLALHPILGTIRRRDGGLVRLVDPAEAETLESFLLFRFDAAPGLDLRPLERSVRGALEEVRRAVEDFPAMRERAEEAIRDLAEIEIARPRDADEIREVEAFLRFLLDGKFVFLGYREYEIVRVGGRRCLRVRPGSGLGLLRDEGRSTYARPVPLSRIPPDLRRRVTGGSLLILSKTNAETVVYKHGRMDYIGVKTLDARGRVVGERRFIGHFAHRAAMAPVRETPILRRKFDEVLEAYRVVPGSHDARAIERLLHSLPRETLFATPVEDLLDEVEVVLETAGEEARAALRYDPARRGYAVTVVMPRERFSPEVRARVQRRLADALGASASPEYHVVVDPEAEIARVHFFFPTEKVLGRAEVERLREEIAVAARLWRDRFAQILEARFGPRGRALLARYEPILGEAYRVMVEPEVAVRDVEDLEAMAAAGAETWLSFGRRTTFGAPASVLKVYRRGARLALSEIVPLLADHALEVAGEATYEIPLSSAPIHLHVLLVRGPDGRPLDGAAEARVAALVGAVLRGEAETDRMNGLVVTADLTPREIERFRAIHGYFRQSGAVQTRRSISNALLAHPAFVRALRDLWAAKFDPALGAADSRRRSAVVRTARRRAEEGLAEVEALEDDRILRGFLAIVEAAVRTNEYVEPRSAALAFKIDCDRVPWFRRPRPWREIYVESPAMAGCHLRFGPIARGGIRWSDRPDDFRTEVLGLARTQTVKNAQIVPTGAKGGFVLKRPPREREALRLAGLEAYKTFIRALLDVTDDWRGGRVVPPPRVVRHDGDDPYLVVAADKGTATFSDVANAIAASSPRRGGFWLGDAFASGGSRGYDHKKEAITARGAWECVKRHFREMGRDAEREPITVAGIGDMSGDVFGNGLLLMRRARLVAAFDHRHVFVDPDPDAERSWRERLRLFRAGLRGRSSWADYRPAVLSRGGGVWGRTEKGIRLPEPARRLLGLGAAPTDGEAIVRAILALDVDLLWNGGIGTYVKSSEETHAEVGDPANDTVRIDAAALRAKVVGEGGNLGLTQRARIEAAARGVRLNTDAIDNAGGVHLSDREVNLKIFLAGRRDRDRLLAAAKGDVVEAVLEANRLQSLAISMDVERSRQALGEFAGFMTDAERRGLLPRRAERLPDADELRDRGRAGEGLHRPEAAVLLAYAKIDAARRIKESPLLTAPEMSRHLEAYFPDRIVRLYGRRLGGHRLRDDLLATVLANRFVNHHGAAALWRLTSGLGLAASRVIAASLRAEEIYGALDLRADLYRTEGRGLWERPYEPFFALEDAVIRATRWIVRHGGEARDFGRLDRRWLSVEERLLPPNERERFDGEVAAAVGRGVPRPLARRVAALRHLRTFLDIVDLARRHRAGVVETGRLLYGVGEALRFPTILYRLETAPRADEWERAAAQNVASELREARRRIADRVLSDYGGSVERYLEVRFRSLETVSGVAGRIEADPEAGITSLVVFADQVNNLASL